MAAQVIDDAQGGDVFDMRRAAIAEPGALTDQQVKALLTAPEETVFDVADEEVIGAESAGEPFSHRHTEFFIEFVIFCGEAVKLDYPYLGLRGTQRLDDTADDGCLAG